MNRAVPLSLLLLAALDHGARLHDGSEVVAAAIGEDKVLAVVAEGGPYDHVVYERPWPNGKSGSTCFVSNQR